MKKGTKMIIKIFEKSLKNHPKWKPKFSKIGLGGVLGGSWGHLGSKLMFWAYLGANLGGSWPDVGPKMGVGGPLGHPFWEPKTSQNPPKIDEHGSKFDINFQCLFDIHLLSILSLIDPWPLRTSKSMKNLRFFKVLWDFQFVASRRLHVLLTSILRSTIIDFGS